MNASQVLAHILKLFIIKAFQKHDLEDDERFQSAECRETLSATFCKKLKNELCAQQLVSGKVAL